MAGGDDGLRAIGQLGWGGWLADSDAKRILGSAIAEEALMRSFDLAATGPALLSLRRYAT